MRPMSLHANALFDNFSLKFECDMMPKLHVLVGSTTHLDWLMTTDY